MSYQSTARCRSSLQYHDFPKLRELHRARLAAAAAAAGSPRLFRTTGSSLLFSSLSSSALLGGSITVGLRPNNHNSRLFHSTTTAQNPISNAFRDLKIKRLELLAQQAPDDANAQYAFLYELAHNHPDALLTRMTHPLYSHFAVNRDVALLFLQTAQRMPNAAGITTAQLEDLLTRLQRGASPADVMMGLTPEVLQHWKQELHSMKHGNKMDQVNMVMQWLVTGSSASTAAAMTAGAGSALTDASRRGGMPMYAPPQGAASAALSRGWDPKSPIYVQLAQPVGVRGAVLGFVGRALLFLVAFSAVGALLDERGLGRGMGMNAGSKHVQEAEQGGRQVKFDDVKGVEEAKAELQEIVLYLKDPSKFTRLGGKLPRGLLLTGPPGTGKTLLAKAIAGEAEVPFFYSSGSQFEEVYVGLGAKRIRELFEAAKKKAPAIIFIDEIDAVGGTRRLKDQSALKMTLNELLVQLDGFDENNGIIVIGATNFMESLDPALLRPGRFDKHVSVPLPDVGGRKEILEMYAKKTKLAPDVDLTVLARGTTGMSGADLYNLMNQAALKASVDGLNSITMAVLEYAKDKILMGAERKSAVITKETAKCTAYHEAGHALVAVLTEGALPIHKATIMPRGNALGMVSMLPEGDQTSQSVKEMLAYMDVAMGGRVAEELVFGKDNVTSGAMSDIQHATRIARNMVTKYGFSEHVGIVFHGNMRPDADDGSGLSDETRARIDHEVKRLTQEAYQRAKDILTKHNREHVLLAETLLEYETLTGDEVRDLIHKRIKPSRPVLNQNGGARGDTSQLKGPAAPAAGSGSSSTDGSGGRRRGGRLFGRQADGATAANANAPASPSSQSQQP